MVFHKSQYSDNEIRLFEMFDYKYLADNNYPVIHLYRCCAEKAFLNDMKGAHVDALRRCLQAMNNGQPFRKTKEFEKLLEF